MDSLLLQGPACWQTHIGWQFSAPPPTHGGGGGGGGEGRMNEDRRRITKILGMITVVRGMGAMCT